MKQQHRIFAGVLLLFIAGTPHQHLRPSIGVSALGYGAGSNGHQHAFHQLDVDGRGPAFDEPEFRTMDVDDDNDHLLNADDDDHQHAFQQQPHNEMDRDTVTTATRRFATRRMYVGPIAYKPVPGGNGTADTSRASNEPPVRLILTTPKRAGSYPVVVFVGGMFGLVPTFWYNALATELASRGTVVVALDLLVALPSNYLASAAYMRDVVDWTRDGRMTRFLAGKLPFRAKIRPAAIVLGSHSAGAQAALYVFDQLRGEGAPADALLLFDPVDSFGPFKDDAAKQALADAWAGVGGSIVRRGGPLSPAAYRAFPPINAHVLRAVEQTLNDDHVSAAAFDIPPPLIDPRKPDQFADVHTPMLILATGLCPVSPVQIPVPPIPTLPPILRDQDSLWPACCPRGIGPKRFWRAFPNSDRWIFNATAFGHCDVLSPSWTIVNRVGNFCKTNLDVRPNAEHKHGAKVTLKTVDKLRLFLADKTEAFLALVVSQMRGHAADKCAAKRRLENIDGVTLDVTADNAYWSGGNIVKC